MTAFDLIALGVIAVSALSGLARGAVRELVGLFAFALSALATVALLPATAPMARHFVHSGWMAAALAALVTFVIVFIFLGVLAGILTARLNQGSLLGGVNRFGGLVFGTARGLLLLGLFAMVFDKATPQSFKPSWITDSAAYPLASDAGVALAKLLPQGANAIGAFTPRIGDAIDAQSGEDPQSGTTESFSEPTPTPSTTRLHKTPSSERAKHPNHGYTQHARDSVDALVERSN
jgi:membrane protein required for colicin V production